MRMSSAARSVWRDWFESQDTALRAATGLRLAEPGTERRACQSWVLIFCACQFWLTSALSPEMTMPPTIDMP